MLINGTQTIWVPRDPLKLMKELDENVDQYRFKFIISIVLCWLGIIAVSVITYFVFAIFGLLYLSLIIIPAMSVIAVFQYILVHAAHECVHQDFRTNNFHSLLFAMITVYPLGLTRNLRSEHLRHHREFGNPILDPDYDAYWPFPTSKISFLFRIFSNISGFSAIRQVMNRIYKKGESLSPKKQLNFNNSFELAMVILFQISILLIFENFCGFIFYFVLYLFPLITFTKLFSQLRGLAEHGDPSNLPTLRSFHGTDIVGKIFGAYGFRQHATHHLVPTLPSEKLTAADHLMMNSSKIEKDIDFYEVQIYKGNHLQLLIDWFIRLPWRNR